MHHDDAIIWKVWWWMTRLLPLPTGIPFIIYIPVRSYSTGTGIYYCTWWLVRIYTSNAYPGIRAYIISVQYDSNGLRRIMMMLNGTVTRARGWGPKIENFIKVSPANSRQLNWRATLQSVIISTWAASDHPDIPWDIRTLILFPQIFFQFSVDRCAMCVVSAFAI